MGNRLNVSHGAPQNQASFIVDRGWKSSNSSPLPVEGEVFFLTFPFIDQAISPLENYWCNRDLTPTSGRFPSFRFAERSMVIALSVRTTMSSVIFNGPLRRHF